MLAAVGSAPFVQHNPALRGRPGWTLMLKKPSIVEHRSLRTQFKSRLSKNHWREMYLWAHAKLLVTDVET